MNYIWGDVMKLILVILTLLLTMTTLVPHDAFVIVPGTDLVAAPLSDGITPDCLPYKESATSLGSRLHQLLFNERVTIIKQEKDYSCIKVNSAYYGTPQRTLKNEYWVLNSHLVTFDTLRDLKIPVSIVPTENTTTTPSITLLKRWKNPASNIVYYPGTRFTLVGEQSLPHVFCCSYYDPIKKATSYVKINRDKCHLNNNYTHAHAQQLFVNLLKARAHAKQPIPYIWGGSGYKGFDCAGLIYRTARIAGIPLFLKNSSALSHHLKPVDSFENLKEGDIIWLPGHVLVIADLKNNTLIEARCYGHGYGKIHEAPLRELFSEIKTFNDLWRALQEKKPLSRLAKNGTILVKVPTFKLLQLESAWHVVPPL